LLPVLPAGTGGTGGGESGLGGSLLSGSPFHGFAEPAYQKRSIHGKVFGNQKHRMVPDIAADGDPSTGFKIFSSDPELASDQDHRGLVQVGGTSLSSPVSAALFTNTLASAGRHSGIGDIHRALYAAYRKGKHAFRDVRSGSNGASADRGRDPSVTAHRGYDTVSGLGGVLWPAVIRYLHLHQR
jgi:subtilase family serine protease